MFSAVSRVLAYDQCRYENCPLKKDFLCAKHMIICDAGGPVCFTSLYCNKPFSNHVVVSCDVCLFSIINVESEKLFCNEPTNPLHFKRTILINSRNSKKKIDFVCVKSLIPYSSSSESCSDLTTT